ncbi:unnamed protein product [Lactuca saligna]|uniref:Uncharacterized protein n=1 Tax=Lactuca saligna TaxID=75948 RepID=A0AA36ELX9_LACSI|nr:unnamed protein product [Lactuca saligna]
MNNCFYSIPRLVTSFLQLDKFGPSQSPQIYPFHHHSSPSPTPLSLPLSFFSITYSDSSVSTVSHQIRFNIDDSTYTDTLYNMWTSLCLLLASLTPYWLEIRFKSIKHL